jgi:hypothetical protein
MQYDMCIYKQQQQQQQQQLALGNVHAEAAPLPPPPHCAEDTAHVSIRQHTSADAASAASILQECEGHTLIEP